MEAQTDKTGEGVTVDDYTKRLKSLWDRSVREFKKNSGDWPCISLIPYCF